MNEDTQIAAPFTDEQMHPYTKESEQELERFLGAAESWGAVLREKPALSASASIPSDLLKVGA